MKKLVSLLLLLMTIFAGLWATKSKNPTGRPDSYLGGIDASKMWWQASGLSGADAKTEWQLDPEIPKNYLPLPGTPNVYMVVDENGYITGYRKRIKQADGSWKWEDTNPDIPENYQPVPGLKDVYKVTYDDGTVKYFKYIRNADDTFAFVEVDGRGNPLGQQEPKGDAVPENYKEVAPNKYAVQNEHGVTIGYKQRVKDADTGDTVWNNIEDPGPSLPQPTPAPKEKSSNLTFDIGTLTGGDHTGGVKNFTPPPMGDLDLDPMATPAPLPNMPGTVLLQPGQNGGAGIYIPPIDGGDINYTFITPPPNMPAPGGAQGGNPVFVTFPPGFDPTSGRPGVTMPPVPNGGMIPSGPEVTIPPMVVEQGSGTYTETENIYNSEIKDGCKVTYLTVVERRYDSQGNLLSSNRKNPVEVGREQLQSAAAGGQPASTLNAELTRIGAGVKYNGPVPNELLALINQERAANGLPSLGMSGSSSVYTLALCRAAMMAAYDTSDNNLPQYGNLAQMMSMYGIGSSFPSESLWRTGATSADSIFGRLMSSGSTKAAILSGNYTQAGIAIAEKNGNFYVAVLMID